MPLLGAHMSIAGGYYRAVDAARAVECDCVQIFTKNNNQWRAKPIAEEEAQRFKQALVAQDIRAPLSHTSYLINLASPEPQLWRQSIDALVVELQRAEQLGIPYVVLHPGSFTSSSEAVGLTAVARALDECFRQTRGLAVVCLLENTAGQGSNLGWRFEHLAEITAQCKFADRLGVCIDTCHTFAAGYPLSEPAAYEQTMKQLDKIVGLARVKAIHVNDSKMPFGSRKDRHEHIGRGAMGLEPFRNLVNDPRFADMPMYLETEKGTEKGEDLDAINLRTLRSLIGSTARVTTKSKSKAPAKSLARRKESPSARAAATPKPRRAKKIAKPAKKR